MDHHWRSLVKVSPYPALIFCLRISIAIIITFFCSVVHMSKLFNVIFYEFSQQMPGIGLNSRHHTV